MVYQLALVSHKASVDNKQTFVYFPVFARDPNWSNRKES